MDIGRAFTYMFDDEDWLKKIAIGGLVTLIPILNLVALGYAIRATQNIRQGREVPLPEWDDWGGDFVKGLLFVIAAIIWALPAIIVMVLGAVFASAMDEEACLWIAYCPGVLWLLLVAVISPALWLQFAKDGDFGAFFRLGALWAIIRDHLSDYLVAFLLSIVASVVASVVGSVACGIGIIFTAFWAYLVQAHLYAHIEPTVAAPEPEVVI